MKVIRYSNDHTADSVEESNPQTHKYSGEPEGNSKSSSPLPRPGREEGKSPRCGCGALIEEHETGDSLESCGETWVRKCFDAHLAAMGGHWTDRREFFMAREAVRSAEVLIGEIRAFWENKEGRSGLTDDFPWLRLPEYWLGRSEAQMEWLVREMRAALALVRGDK